MELTTAFLAIDGLISNGQRILTQLRTTLHEEIKAGYVQRIEELKNENAQLKLQLLKETTGKGDAETIMELRRNLDAERERTRVLELKLKSQSDCALEWNRQIKEDKQEQQQEEEEDSRMIPASFTQSNASLEKTSVKKDRIKGQRPGRSTTLPSHSHEADLDSNEFRTFLKKRRFETGDSANYKYVEVVRRKADREKLPAHDCINCKAFYLSLINGAHSSKTQFHNSDSGRGQELIKCVGRHRGLHSPPKTPSSYWDLDFPDSPRINGQNSLSP